MVNVPKLWAFDLRSCVSILSGIVYFECNKEPKKNLEKENEKTRGSDSFETKIIFLYNEVLIIKYSMIFFSSKR